MDHEIFHRPLAQLNARRAVFADPDLPTSEVILLMKTKDEPCILVGSSDALQGVITERDILVKVAGKPEAVSQPVSAHMTADPVTLSSEASVGDALQAMAEGGYRHIPVTDDGKVARLVSVTDLIDFLVIHFPDAILNPWFDIKPGDSYG